MGHGSFGVVFRGKLDVAVKIFREAVEKKSIETEITNLLRVQHENIIRLYGVSKETDAYYLVMECAQNGTLHDCLHTKKIPFSESDRQNLMLQCAKVRDRPLFCII